MVVKTRTVDGVTLQLFGTEFPPDRANCDYLQLQEKQFYEYRLPEDFQLEENDVVTRSRINPGQGQIHTGNYAGLLDLRLCRRLDAGGYVDTGKYFTVEIQSGLLNYERDYRAMLGDITEHTADLLLQLSSPVYSRLTKKLDAGPAGSGAQQLFFLLGLIQDSRFQNAVRMIISRPNSRWAEAEVAADIRSLRRFSGSDLRQFASAVNRTPVPAAHPLAARFAAVPARMLTRRLSESPDTPENRFVKYVLTFFVSELERLRRQITPDGSCRVVLADAEHALRDLRRWLSRDFFKRLPPLTAIPGNSPLLQRREGYREVLRKWVQYRVGAVLDWDGAEEVFKGGQRNLAVLYEYWCFFQLLKILREKFQVGAADVQPLLGTSSDGLGLKLQAGRELQLSGLYVPASGPGRPLNIRFSYNRTFSGVTGDFQRAGSWTLSMRPDYTVSFWPADLPDAGPGRGEARAEALDLITHVHFDAKYKAVEYLQLLEEDSGSSGPLRESAEEWTAKRGDLLKMHSYRDAIRRTGGAYILYPGSQKKIRQGYHELLPGLGAFPLRPGSGPEADGSGDLKTFLDDLAGLLCDRISQWERSTFYRYDVHRSPWKHGAPPPVSLPPLPPVTPAGVRVPPLQSYDALAETFVVKTEGYRRHKVWYQERRLYNLPVNYKNITPSQAERTRYLLVATGDGWKLLKVFFREIVSREWLQDERSYHSRGKHGRNGYYLYELQSDLLPALDDLTAAAAVKIFRERNCFLLSLGELLSARPRK